MYKNHFETIYAQYRDKMTFRYDYNRVYLTRTYLFVFGKFVFGYVLIEKTRNRPFLYLIYFIVFATLYFVTTVYFMMNPKVTRTVSEHTMHKHLLE